MNPKRLALVITAAILISLLLAIMVYTTIEEYGMVSILQTFANGLLAGLSIFVIVATLVWFATEFNILLTRVPQGYGRIIEVNGEFAKAVMTYRGHQFRGDSGATTSELAKVDQLVRDGHLTLGPEWETGEYNNIEDGFVRRAYAFLGIDEWDVMARSTLGEDDGLFNPFRYFRNIYWVGLPPFAGIYKHVFRWTSYEQKGDSAKRVPVPHEEEQDFWLAKRDIYYVVIEDAETAGRTERFPVNVQLLLTIRIVNPMKAFSRAQRWLELVTDQLDSRTRRFIGEKTLDELIDDRTDDNDKLSSELSDSSWDLVGEFRRIYGVDVEKIQILQIDPPKELRELTLKEYAATQEGIATVIKAENAAKARRLEADAEQEYIDKTLGRTVELGGPDAVKWGAVRDGKLTTFVDGGGILGKLLGDDSADDDRTRRR